MAERLNKCPKCGSIQYTDNIVKAHNPETQDLNMAATLRCGNGVVWNDKVSYPSQAVESCGHEWNEVIEGCGHEWEGRVSSPNYQKMRERGWII